MRRKLMFFCRRIVDIYKIQRQIMLAVNAVIPPEALKPRTWFVAIETSVYILLCLFGVWFFGIKQALFVFIVWFVVEMIAKPYKRRCTVSSALFQTRRIHYIVLLDPVDLSFRGMLQFIFKEKRFYVRSIECRTYTRCFCHICKGEKIFLVKQHVESLSIYHLWRVHLKHPEQLLPNSKLNYVADATLRKWYGRVHGSRPIVALDPPMMPLIVQGIVDNALYAKAPNMP